MSTPAYLFAALKALAPAGRTFHDYQAPETAQTPWIVGALLMPEPKTGLVANVHAATGIWRVTVAAATGAQAVIVAAEVEAAWSGRRVDVEGWNVSAIRPPRVDGPRAAGLTALDTNLRYQVVTLEFDLTASRIPATV